MRARLFSVFAHFAEKIKLEAYAASASGFETRSASCLPPLKLQLQISKIALMLSLVLLSGHQCFNLEPYPICRTMRAEPRIGLGSEVDRYHTFGKSPARDIGRITLGNNFC